MNIPKTADDFYSKELTFKGELARLRSILLSTGLTETIKWGIPVYCFGKENVVGCCEFNHHFGLWFYQGALLQDEHQKLINANEASTKAMRQWRMTSMEEIDEQLIKHYLIESIENFKIGNKITPKKQQPLVLPEELYQLLLHQPDLKDCFELFNLTKKREFCEYIESAKRIETKIARLQKITPLILQGIGLNDRYRNSKK